MRAEAFLDTNVLLYAVGDDEAKRVVAEGLLVQGGVISVQVLNEFAAVSSRKLARSWTDIAAALAAIRAMPLRIAPLTVAVHESGLRLAESDRLSLYDAMIVASAAEAGCAVLYSEDMQDGRRHGELIVRNPFGPRASS